MKKTILCGLALAMFASTTVAYADPLDVQGSIYEQESGAMSRGDADVMMHGNRDGDRGQGRDQGRDRGDRRSDREAIIGVIGGIIGAIAADQWDRPGHPGRPGRPGRPHEPGYPGYPGEYVTCFAQNRRGDLFRATARRARIAQDLAMEKCFSYSYSCRPMGCR